jgi:hypothetical protein
MATRWPSLKINIFTPELMAGFSTSLFHRAQHLSYGPGKFDFLIFYMINNHIYALVNQPTFVITLATIRMSRHLNLRWAHGHWTIWFIGSVTTFFFVRWDLLHFALPLFSTYWLCLLKILYSANCLLHLHAHSGLLDDIMLQKYKIVQMPLIYDEDDDDTVLILHCLQCTLSM